MSGHPSLVTLAAVVITAFVLAAGILMSPRAAFAEGQKWETRIHPSDPAAIAPPRELDARDEIAALERIQFALSEVGDGTSYVWRRWHGRLAGVIHPTSSFKDPSGKVCRHLVVLLTTGKRTSKMEGIACRLASGRWQLEG
jgi:hypothetical protein